LIFAELTFKNLMMRHLISFILCLHVCKLTAQQLPDPLLTAVAGASGYHPADQDAWGVLCNPASVAHTRDFTVGIYGERKFLLEGLQQFCGVVALPLPLSGLGLQLDYSGSFRMNETAFGMVYGRRLGDRMAAGLRFRYYGLRVPGHVRASALWAEAGVTYKLSERIYTGFSWSYATPYRLEKNEPPLFQSYRMGVGYEVSSRLYLMSEWLKHSRQDMQGSFVVRYVFEEGFRLRLGLNTLTAQPVIGAGIFWQKTWFDIMVAYHPYLGFTPGVQCVFSPNHKNEKRP
jgi:hypothetical protein